MTPMTPAEKHNTAVVDNNLNPKFISSNSFVAEWDVPIMEALPQNIQPENASVPESAWKPWTQEHLSLEEQMEFELLYLGTRVFLDGGGRCKAAKFTKACEMLNKLTQV